MSANNTNQTTNPQELATGDLSNYIIKKTEKISQALYLLTNYLPLEEPFRRNIREKALGLIDELYHLQIDRHPRTSALVQLVETRFTELSAIMMVGVRAGLISEMNFNILREEMNALRQLANERLTSAAPALDSDFFKTTLPASLVKNNNENVKDSNLDSVDHYGSIKQNDTTTTPDEISTADTDKPKGQGVIKASKFSPNFNDVNQIADNSKVARRRNGTNHSRRRTQILQLFQEANEIDISDVQSVIEGCSQKTMQRELKSMVEDKLLEKRGKKRWSSYVLHPDVTLADELG